MQGTTPRANQHSWFSLQILSRGCKAMLKRVSVSPYTQFCTLFAGQSGCRLWAGPRRGLYLLIFLLLSGSLASSWRWGHVSPACSRKGYNICSTGWKKASLQESRLFSILTWSQKSQLVLYFPRCLWSSAPHPPSCAPGMEGAGHWWGLVVPRRSCGPIHQPPAQFLETGRPLLSLKASPCDTWMCLRGLRDGAKTSSRGTDLCGPGDPMQWTSQEFVLESPVPKISWAEETGKLPAPEAFWDQSLLLVVCSPLWGAYEGIS